jgi:hypothetical protein
MTPQVKERIVALVFALVIVISVLCAVVAFALVANVVPEQLKQVANIFVFGGIILNALFSAFMWVHLRGGIVAGADAKKAYDLASLAAVSVFWDVLAMLFALMGSASPVLYAGLGIALTVDTISDVFTHIKR